MEEEAVRQRERGTARDSSAAWDSATWKSTAYGLVEAPIIVMITLLIAVSKPLLDDVPATLVLFFKCIVFFAYGIHVVALDRLFNLSTPKTTTTKQLVKAVFLAEVVWLCTVCAENYLFKIETSHLRCVDLALLSSVMVKGMNSLASLNPVVRVDECYGLAISVATDVALSFIWV